MLIALHKEISIPQPSEALIRNLLATNLCVVFVAYWSLFCREGGKLVKSSFMLKSSEATFRYLCHGMH